MTPEETGNLLGVCAAYDNRQVDEVGTIAWYRVLGDLPYQACERAVIEHYTGSRDWIMPADIRTAVKRARAIEAARDHTRTVLDPAAYRAAIDAADTAFVRKLEERAGRKLALKAPPEPDYADTTPEAARREVSVTGARIEQRRQDDTTTGYHRDGHRCGFTQPTAQGTP